MRQTDAVIGHNLCTATMTSQGTSSLPTIAPSSSLLCMSIRIGSSAVAIRKHLSFTTCFTWPAVTHYPLLTFRNLHHVNYSIENRYSSGVVAVIITLQNNIKQYHHTTYKSKGTITNYNFKIANMYNIRHLLSNRQTTLNSSKKNIQLHNLNVHTYSKNYL